ncbi:hypothetical protein CR159_17375 [Pollutimonas subterranea]|uniref:Uncharacterized protein n=1 Tax=Pollutimonas subterranea TaxID=2045210 RepID=A0A2N4U0P4_9BURK|nr:hypothetical protein CR159_17375 [Pollutimonas subterranea]
MRPFCIGQFLRNLLATLAGPSIYWPTLNVVVTTTIDPAYARLASGIYNTARLNGVFVGIVKLGSLLRGARHALIGLRIGVLLIVGCMIGVVVVTLRYINS